MTSAIQSFAEGHQLFLREGGTIVLQSLAFIFLVGLSLAAVCQTVSATLSTRISLRVVFTALSAASA